MDDLDTSACIHALFSIKDIIINDRFMSHIWAIDPQEEYTFVVSRVLPLFVMDATPPRALDTLVNMDLLCDISPKLDDLITAMMVRSFHCYSACTRELDAETKKKSDRWVPENFSQQTKQKTRLPKKERVHDRRPARQRHSFY